MKQNRQEMSLPVRVVRVRLFKPDSGFCVFDAEPLESMPGEDGLLFRTECFPVVMSMTKPPQEGQQLRVIGRLVRGDRFGVEFKASMAFQHQETSPVGLTEDAAVRFLMDYFKGKGIGPRTALEIVSANGPEAVWCIIQGQLDELKLSSRARKALESAPVTDREAAAALLTVAALGLSKGWVEKIYQALGPDASSLVQANPFLLMKVPGIGFHRAARVSSTLGYGPGTAVHRFGALCSVIEDSVGEGHVCVPAEAAVARAAELCQEPAEAFETVLNEVPGAREILVMHEVPRKGGMDRYLYLRKLLEVETQVARMLSCLAGEEAPWGLGREVVAAALDGLQFPEPLTSAQRQAASMPFLYRLSVLTGLPGTGKTTAVRAIVSLARRFGLPLHLAAPTGRAAMRLTEVTGCKAMTLHRMLGMARRNEGGASRGRLPVGIYVVDESSMIDLELFRTVLAALPRSSSVLFVGDPNQLPSVGPGNVLNDLIAVCPQRVHLSEVFRQSLHSGIVRAAHAMLNGKDPRPRRVFSASVDPVDCVLIETPKAEGRNGKPTADPEKLVEVLKQFLSQTVPHRWKLDPVKEVQVLTPQRRGPLGTDRLNAELQRVLNPHRKGPSIEVGGHRFWRGDKVMVCRNSYRYGIFNGEVAVIEWIDPQTRELLLDFGDRMVQLDLESVELIQPAYASTIHKSQGCEYRVVVVVAHKSHAMMLTRNLMYTAITRAVKHLVFIGDPIALWMAARTDRQVARQSLLAWRVRTLAEAA